VPRRHASGAPPLAPTSPGPSPPADHVGP
jgi:hypothetical protein